jgi:hypothetical protein
MFQDDRSRAWPLDSLRKAPARFDAAPVDRFGARLRFLQVRRCAAKVWARDPSRISIVGLKC